MRLRIGFPSGDLVSEKCCGQTFDDFGRVFTNTRTIHRMLALANWEGECPSKIGPRELEWLSTHLPNTDASRKLYPSHCHDFPYIPRLLSWHSPM